MIGPGNVASLHQLWLARTGAAAGIGGVSIAGGKAYLGTGMNLHAWAAPTGARRWSALADGASESTAAVGGGRVFIESGNGTLYAFSTATGAKLWSQASGGVVTSPVLVKNVVYEAGDSSMNAYDAATGTLLWTTGLGDLVRSVPAVWGGRVFVAAETGGGRLRNVFALNASTGVVLWRKGGRKTDGTIQGASPVVGANTVYVCTSTGLYAFGTLHGDLHWSEPSGCDSNATPVLAQGVLYTAFQNGGVWAFNASTGALLWTTNSSNGIFFEAPAVANGVLYVTTSAGAIAAYDTATHALLWTSPRLGFGSPPAVVNGILYAGGTRGLYSFGP